MKCIVFEGVLSFVIVEAFLQIDEMTQHQAADL